MRKLVYQCQEDDDISELALIIKRYLLRVKYFMGKREEALTELKELYLASESRLGEGHLEVYRTRLIVVHCLRHAKQYDEALEILTDVLQEQKTKCVNFEPSSDVLATAKK